MYTGLPASAMVGWWGAWRVAAGTQWADGDALAVACARRVERRRVRAGATACLDGAPSMNPRVGGRGLCFEGRARGTRPRGRAVDGAAPPRGAVTKPSNVSARPLHTRALRHPVPRSRQAQMASVTSSHLLLAVLAALVSGCVRGAVAVGGVRRAGRQLERARVRVPRRRLRGGGRKRLRPRLRPCRAARRTARRSRQRH
jgi:hypothetical protein